MKNQYDTSNFIPSQLKGNFWLVTADMGYGHLRAIYPLKALSKGGKILDVNTSAYSTLKERSLWKEMLGTYEFMSRAGKLPLLDLKKSIRRGLCKGILDETKWPELPNDNLILFISYSC